MKKIMILGGSNLQLPIIRKAKEMNLYTIVLDYDANAIGFEEADETYILSTNDIEKAIKLAEKIRPDGIVTMATDMPMRTVAAVGERLKLNTISFQTAMNATDKFFMREKLKESGIPIPKYYCVSTKQDFFEKSSLFTDKFIVKPADSSGSKGVILCDKQDDLDYIYSLVKSYSVSKKILLEEYMIGPEISVESLTLNDKTEIIAITDKLKTPIPYFVEMGHSIPSKIEKHIQDEVENITIRAIKAIGINIGPAHTEIIITNDGPKIVELGARLGGDNITSHLVPLATGIDMVKAVINLSLGEGLPKFSKQNSSAAIRYISGVNMQLKKDIQQENFKKVNGFVEINLDYKKQRNVGKVLSSNDRLGYVIATSNNVDSAINICENIIKKVSNNNIIKSHN